MAIPAVSMAATYIWQLWKGRSFVQRSIAPPPIHSGSYDWVSTTKGQSGAAKLLGFTGSVTTASELIADALSGAIGQRVSFYFNYITFDGSGFVDYGFAQLINSTTGFVANLFTAPTQPAG
ncbi:hypothetical protein HNO88_004208 [Novosphingobium chloroacetimidivorans]|uniref:Uncharacterized protein n=1 Tax=Novosphingobium chloroacetimidivorans TaxID=1428314 RepID=A0A7W7KDK5_9SPHN|nr:hypothetical protein [Novosphingobium chloroacetimidivorans]MBB4860862.1 hypothetical protein [Novosphingobium chloroacetimidivorans]